MTQEKKIIPISQKLRRVAVRFGLIAETPRPHFAPSGGFTIMEEETLAQKDPIKHATEEVQNVFGDIKKNSAQIVEKLARLIDTDFPLNRLDINSRRFLQFAVMDQLTKRAQKVHPNTNLGPVLDQIDQERDVFITNLPFAPTRSQESLQEIVEPVAAAAVEVFFDPIPKAEDRGHVFYNPRKQIAEVLAKIAKLERSFFANQETRASSSI